MNVMSLADFRNTRTECNDLRALLDDECVSQRGLVYHGQSFIETTEDGQHMLTLGSEGWITPETSLAEMESHLYLWMLTEDTESMAASPEFGHLVAAVWQEVGTERLAAFIAGHVDSESLDNIVDIWELAPEAYGNEHELDENGIDALISEINEWADQCAYATDYPRGNGA